MNPLAHYHRLIERLLGPDGDIPAAAQAFLEPITAAAGPDEIESLLEVAWDVLVTAAGDTPDNRQPRLVGLVAGVQQHEIPGVRVWAQRVLTDLPLLGDRMSRTWDEPLDPAVRLRLNAFAARLTASVTDFLPLGLRTITAALESSGGPLPPAVEWFRHAGPQLVAASLHGRTYAGRLGDTAERPEGGFSVARWTVWRTRLDELTRTGDRTAREGFRLITHFDARIIEHYRRP